MIVGQTTPLYPSPVITGYSVSYSAGRLVLPDPAPDVPWNKRQKLEIGVAIGGASGFGATLMWHVVHGIAGAHGPSLQAIAKAGEFILGGVVFGGAAGAAVIGMGSKVDVKVPGLRVTAEQPS